VRLRSHRDVLVEVFSEAGQDPVLTEDGTVIVLVEVDEGIVFRFDEDGALSDSRWGKFSPVDLAHFNEIRRGT